MDTNAGRVLNEDEIKSYEAQCRARGYTFALNLIATIRDRDRQIAELREQVEYWREEAATHVQYAKLVDDQNAMMLEALETYVRECRDCKDGYIDGLRCDHCWTARDTLAKVRKSAMREMWLVSEELGLYDDCEGGEA